MRSLVLLIVTAVLIGSMRWGLPSRERNELLLHGTELTSGELAEIRSLTSSYFEQRDEADQFAAEQLEQGVLVPGHRATEIGAELSDVEKLRAVRRFLLSSSAVDERKPYIALARMDPRHGDLDPRGFMYGGAYLYLVGATLLAWETVGWLDAPRDATEAVDHPEQVARMYLAGRLPSLLAFLGVALLLLAWARNRECTREAATLAMAVWVTSTQPLTQALVSKPHVYAAFWVFAATYALHGHSRTQGTRWLAASGLCMGMAAGSSLVSAAAGILFPIVLWERPGLRFWRRLGLVLASMTVAVVVTNPYVLVSPEQYLRTVLQMGSSGGSGHGVLDIGKGWHTLRDLLVRGYSFPLGILGAVGSLWQLIRGRCFLRRLSLAFWVLLLGVGSTDGRVRHMIFLGPWLCLFAGIGWVVLFQYVVRRARPAVAKGLTFALLAPGILFFAIFARDSLSDEAWLAPARVWADELATFRTEHGHPAVLGIFDRPEPSDHPPFPFLRAPVLNLVENRDPDARPEFVLVGSLYYGEWYWDAHPLRREYALAYELGVRRTDSWLLGFRTRGERTRGRVYRLIPTPA